MAFDRHMNLVLGDAEEFRKLPPKKGMSEEDVSRRGRRAGQGRAGGLHPRAAPAAPVSASLQIAFYRALLACP